MSSVAELVAAAHANAREKGFWGSENVAEKLALIGTEVNEFLVEFEAGNEVLEEVADIVIRTFDLCGYLKVSLPEDVLTEYENRYIAHHRFAFVQFQYIAAVTQAHRKDKREQVERWLGYIIRWCARYAGVHHGEGELLKAITTKMQKNQARPHKHGALY